MPELAISGGVWNARHTDYEMCGQCIDTLCELLPDNKKLQRIKQIWEQYDLNDLQAGTKKQVEAVELWKQRGNKYDYTAACEHLKSIGLYEDKGYKYGSAWLYMSIPDEIIDEVKNL